MSTNTTIHQREKPTVCRETSNVLCVAVALAAVLAIFLLLSLAMELASPRLAQAETYVSTSEPAPLVLTGLQALAKGDLGKAALAFSDRLAEAPEDTTALTHLGLVMVKLGADRQATSCFVRASELEPKDPFPIVWLGLISLRQGKGTRAEAYFKQAAEVSPSLGTPHFYMGLMDARAGRDAQAAAHFRAALNADYGDPDAFYQLGRALLALGQADDAKTAFGKALALAPNHTHSLVALSWLEYTRKQGASVTESWRATIASSF